MNPFHGLLSRHAPVTFNPKVTPDPTESERLEAKLHEATQRLNERIEKAMMRRSRRTVMEIRT